MTISRREALKGFALAGAGTLAVGSPTLAASFRDELNIGVIGMGGRGKLLAGAFKRLPQVRLTAVCDVDSARADEAAKKLGVETTYTNYEDLLADKSIDAVVIATCNHWHCLAAIHACQAGKHVYVEKPLGHDLWQQQQLIAAARKYKRVVQVGTQQRSDPMQDEIRNFLHTEKGIGEIAGAAAVRLGVRKPIGKRDTPLTPSSTVDYDRWVGPAKMEPLYRPKMHYDWHWDWNTGDGEMGNWGVHILDDVRNVILNDSSNLPTAVTSLGARLWDDAGETPNLHLTLFETSTLPVACIVSNLAPPKGKQKMKFGTVESGYVVYAEGGHYEGQRGRGVAYDAQGKVIRKFKGNAGSPTHFQNFVDAVLDNDPSQLNAEVEVGHYSSAWCHYGNAAYLAGEPASAGPAPAQLSDNPAWTKSLDMLTPWLAAGGIETTRAPFVVSQKLAVDQASAKLQGKLTDAAAAIYRADYRKGYEIPDLSTSES